MATATWFVLVVMRFSCGLACCKYLPDGRYNRHKVSLFLLAHKAVWDLFQRGFGLRVQGQVEWRHNWKWWNYHDVESLLFIILPIVTSSACLYWEIDFLGLSLHVGAFPHGDEWDERICTWGTLEHVCRQPLISSMAQLGSRTLLRRRYLSGWMDRKRLGGGQGPLDGFGSQGWNNVVDYLVSEGGIDVCPQPPELGSKRTWKLVVVPFQFPSLLILFMTKSPVHDYWFVMPPKSHP